MTTITRDTTAALPTVSWQQWSCLVRLVVTDPAVLQRAAADLDVLLRRVDRAASRFRIDSDLCWANANTGRPTAVSATLVRLVDTALAEAARSGGAFDPTLGRDLVRLGYDRDIALVADTDEPPAASGDRRTTWRDVTLDRQFGLLTVPVGAALDLGASAKAQTADWASAELAGRYGCSVLVEIGGDLAVAGAKDDWQVTVAERAGAAGQQLSLAAGGVATSTTTIRRWRRGTSDVHHIVDPATGRPADGPWRTVSVAAGSAVRANTCSTAAVVLGATAVPWLLRQGVAARLVDTTGAVHTIGGWPC